ncbi:HNH endonuclease signature motif containing protein, partial [Corynebacterium sp. DNF00584]|uniref:HNH endonuclease signature motif containing protein n=1 Tax=Corynebacterium sp. DNF00584 TaxID=1384076 RepID=UPI000795482B
TVPAKYAQLDHRVEYGDGGETSTDNLIAVCQHHHNAKTDRRCDYLFDPVTGFVYWLFEDGTWESTEPQGIMAQRWRQTIAQRADQLAAERNLIPLPEPEETSFAD